ncbi:MAG: hypothetical protein HY062_05815 [Bacteroidetes bacterium]|nr:hypothetical protein [Bacteroidota bacterium]
MLKNLKQRVLKGWTLMRAVRTGLAFIVIAQAWSNYDILFAVLGGILLIQSVFNYGCCSASGCNSNHTNNHSKSLHQSEELITFTEIK